MTKTIEVEIDESGVAPPVDPKATVPPGRALLVVQTEPIIKTALRTEDFLSADWLTPEGESLIANKGFVIANNGLPYFPPTGRKLTPEIIKAAQDGELD